MQKEPNRKLCLNKNVLTANRRAEEKHAANSICLCYIFDNDVWSRNTVLYAFDQKRTLIKSTSQLSSPSVLSKMSALADLLLPHVLVWFEILLFSSVY